MYTGNELPIPLGQLGLQTDGPQSQLPVNAATTANNVTFFTGVLAKAPGSVRFNTNALSAAVIAAFDWWDTPTQQQTLAITSDGNAYLDATNDGTFQSNTPIASVATQKISLSGMPKQDDTGYFTLTFGGHTTGHITAAMINTAVALNNTEVAVASAIQTVVQATTGMAAFTVYVNKATSNTVTPAPTIYITMTGTTGPQSLFTHAETSFIDVSSASITVTVANQQAGLASYTFGAINPSDVCIVPGGAEVQGNKRRLFIFSAGKQVQMISGGSTVISQITYPATDWANSFPTYGCIYNSRLVAIMGHNLYFSKLGDHTSFDTTPTDGTGAAVYPIFPGEGDKLISAIVYKGSLLLFKQPFGVYLVNWNGGDLSAPGNIPITRLNDSFALASPHAACQVGDDFWGASLGRSVFSLKATNAFGSFEAGDLLNNAMVRNYFRQTFDPAGQKQLQAMYYPEKSTAYFSGKDSPSSPQNRLLVYDVAMAAGRISVSTKDQATCLFLRKDANLIPRPYYGSDDGFIYATDQGVWDVNGKAYTGEFQTPYSDLSSLDPTMAAKVKLFDFITVIYQQVGNWAFYIDVFVDGVFIQTVTFNMVLGSALDTFVLDRDKLGAAALRYLRMPIKSAAGKTISLRIYNDKLDQTFAIEKVTVSFRVSGEQNRSSKS